MKYISKQKLIEVLNSIENEQLHDKQLLHILNNCGDDYSLSRYLKGKDMCEEGMTVKEYISTKLKSQLL